MKLRKRIIAGFLSALFILCSVSLPVAAAADPYTWDGTSVLAADRTYYIKSNITLGKALLYRQVLLWYCSEEHPLPCHTVLPLI
ncbi:MAG: hypothetical protein ACLTZI_03825 [[Eubacterium] siraeum]